MNAKVTLLVSPWRMVRSSEWISSESGLPNGPTIAAVAHVGASLGDEAAARASLVRMDSIAHERYVMPDAVALVHAALHEPDDAFRWLDRAVADRSHWLVWLTRDTRWASIRADPRFAALVRRVGL